MVMYPLPVALWNETMTYSSNSSSIIFSFLIGFALGLIALITACGNMIVLLAFYCDKKLRTINDYFILNMAIADFLVGFFCIPFYIPFSLTQSWPFGRLFCKIWVTIDDVATMASVINIVAISINRYWSIAYPISYRKYATQHLVYLVMGGVWCLSFINFAPGIWLISLFNKEIDMINGSRIDCSGDYNKSFVYMLIAQFNYFIWPFILLCILNMLIMLNIWKRTRKMTRLMSFSHSIKEQEKENSCFKQRNEHLSKHRRNSCEDSPSMINEHNVNVVIKSLSNEIDHHVLPKYSNTSDQIIPIQHVKQSSLKTRSTFRNELEESHFTSPTINFTRQSASVYYSASQTNCEDSLIEYPIEKKSSQRRRRRRRSRRSKGQCREYQQKQSRIIRDRKAARSLFILVLVFLLFLFPYVICATASTAGLHISTMIFEISFWLLWLNSTCNPFLYPFIQMKYRRAYLQLFQSFQQSFSFSQSN